MQNFTDVSMLPNFIKIEEPTISGVITDNDINRHGRMIIQNDFDRNILTSRKSSVN